MGKQLHNKFSDDFVKVILQKYLSGDLSVKVVCYDGTSSNDLLVGENNSSTPKVVTYYKNIGTYSNPVLTNMGAVKSPGVII